MGHYLNTQQLVLLIANHLLMYLIINWNSKTELFCNRVIALGLMIDVTQACIKKPKHILKGLNDPRKGTFAMSSIHEF